MSFMDVILETPPNSLTCETTLSYYPLIFGAYPKIPKLYCLEIINTEQGV